MEDAVRISHVPNLVHTDLNGEVVLLNVESGHYYGLDEVGTQVWRLLQAPKTLTEIRDALLLHYEVDPRKCMEDLKRLCKDLQKAGLVELHH